jgi:competence protein CoiA
MQMILANTSTGTRDIPHISGEIGACPTCETEVFGRCGRIVTWHWAHRGSDCDPWAEPETPWHYQWKMSLRAKGAMIEQTIQKGNERHRADCVFPDGTVLEIQHSPISVNEIEAREAFYDRMVWLFDTQDAASRGRLLLRRKPDRDTDTFRWKQPKKSIAYCGKPVFLDVAGDEIFHLYRMYPDTPCGGAGKIVSAADVFRGYLRNP